MATESEKAAYEAAYQGWRKAEVEYTGAIDAVFKGNPPDSQRLQRLADELQRAHDSMMEKARPIMRLAPVR